MRTPIAEGAEVLAMACSGDREEAGERCQHDEQWLDRSGEEEGGKRQEDRKIVPRDHLGRKVQPQRRNKQRHRDQSQIQQRRLARDEIGGNERADGRIQRAQELAGLDFRERDRAGPGMVGGRGVHRAPKAQMKCEHNTDHAADFGGSSRQPPTTPSVIARLDRAIQYAETAEPE